MQQTISYEKIQLIQSDNTASLFKNLLAELKGSEAILKAIHNLEYNITSAIVTIEVEDRIEAALSLISKEQPTLLSRIASQIESAGYGAAAGYALEWISQHIK